MAIHKVTITANAGWFSIEPRNNASWVLPKDQEIGFGCEIQGQIGAMVLRTKMFMLQSLNGQSGNFNVVLYAETDEASLAIGVASSDSLIINSGVDQLAVNDARNFHDVTLRLI